MVAIDLISDLHGYYPELEGGDLLIVAGDLTARDDEKGWIEFENWIFNQHYREKIIIAGNHDNFLQTMDEHRMWKYWDKIPCVTYLCDSGTEFEGLKIWGSPWTRTFEGMNPHCKAFTVDTEKELAEKWLTFPIDIDILITHNPPYGILDKVASRSSRAKKGEHVGSKSLAHKIGHTETPPKLWVWGHIHEAYGKDLPVRGNPCIMVNASHVNERYEPVNKPIRIIL